MKKFCMTIFAIMFLVIIASGCGGTKVDDELPNDKPKIKVEFYHSGYGENYMKQIVDTFNARAIKGEYDFYVTRKANSNISADFAQQMKNYSSSTFADVSIVAMVGTNLYGSTGKVVDVTDVWNTEVPTAGAPGGMMKIKEKINQDLVAGYDVDGKFYGMPNYSGVTGILYNKKLFNEYGLSVPQTMAEMDDLLESIDSLSRNTDSSPNNDIYAMIYPSKATDYFRYIERPLFMQMLGKQAYYDLIDMKDAATVVPSYENVYTNVWENFQVFQEETNKKRIISASTHTLTLSAFAQQKALMTPCGDWTQNEIGAAMDLNDIGLMTIPLICDLTTNKVIAKATEKSVVFAGVNMNDSAAVEEAEKYYFKIAKNKVDASVIPTADKDESFIYFRKISFSNAGTVDVLIPAKNTSTVAYSKQFMAYLVSDEALNLFTKYTGSVMPYNFIIDEGTKSSLSNFNKICVDMGVNNQPIVTIATSKGVRYGLINFVQGAPASYYTQLLIRDASYVTPISVYNSVKSGITAALANLERDIGLYETANGIS